MLYNNVCDDDDVDDTVGSASPLSSELQVDKGLDTDQGVSTVVGSKGELDKCYKPELPPTARAPATRQF